MNVINRIPTQSIELSAEIARQTEEFVRNGGEIKRYDSSANSQKSFNLSDFSLNGRTSNGVKKKPTNPKMVKDNG